MVAAVLGIRLHTTVHLMRREWWRALVWGGGAIWILLMVPSVLLARGTLAGLDPDLRGDALIAVAALLALGWAVVPIVTAGLDDTLDPVRFRALGLEARALMPGLAAAAVLTLPALFTAMTLTVLGSAWAADGAAVLAAAMAGAVLTLGCLLTGARVSAMWASRVLASNRARGIALAVTAAAMLAAVPLAWQLYSRGLDYALEGGAEVVLEQLGRTPLGAGAAAPAALAEGDALGALWRLAMLAGWLVLLLGAWRANVDHALLTPRAHGSGQRRTRDEILDPRRGIAAPRDPAARAVYSRLRRAWRSDPRYLATLAGAFALPTIFLVLVVPILDLDRRWLYAVPLILAASVGWGRHNDVAYDSSGLWLDVTAGRLGAAVMRGRLAAALAWAGPAVGLVALGTLAWSGRWNDAPGLLGACAGVLGMSLGISAVAAVLVPYRVPAPGQNPFGAEVGSVGAGFVAQLASSAVAFLTLPLVVAPFVLSLTAAPWWGYVALPAGLAVGGIAYRGGVHLGGLLYDRRSGRLLAAVS